MDQCRPTSAEFGHCRAGLGWRGKVVDWLRASLGRVRQTPDWRRPNRSRCPPKSGWLKLNLGWLRPHLGWFSWFRPSLGWNGPNLRVLPPRQGCSRPYMGWLRVERGSCSVVFAVSHQHPRQPPTGIETRSVFSGSAWSRHTPQEERERNFAHNLPSRNWARRTSLKHLVNCRPSIICMAGTTKARSTRRDVYRDAQLKRRS